MSHQPDLTGLDLQAASTIADLALLLRRLHARAGKPSYRVLERRAEDLHRVNRDTVLLPKTTTSAVLSGQRLPSRDFVLSFVQVCGVASDDIGPWLNAHGRVSEHLHVLSSMSTDNGVQENSAGDDIRSPSSKAQFEDRLTANGIVDIDVWEIEPIALRRPPDDSYDVRLPIDSARAHPPTLGGVSKAARAPWRLPIKSSPPAIAADEARLGDLDVRAASVVGPSNRCEEPARPRQDAYRLGRDPEGSYLMVAIADGVSSAERAEYGAAVAVASAIRQLQRLVGTGVGLDGISANEVFGAVAEDMMSVALQQDLAVTALSATLLAGVIPTSPTSTGMRTAWFGWLANPSGWLKSNNSWSKFAGNARSAVLSNKLAEVLPLHPDMAQSKTMVLEPGDMLALVTDGCGDAFEDVQGGSEWFVERWRDPPPIASFMLDVGYEARMCGDDRTAVAIWCPALISRPNGRM